MAPTGVPGLDEAIGGGFIRGRTYLVTGETGTGKTLLALTYLINGALKFGEPGLYVSVDETYDQLVDGARRFGWDIESLRQQGLIEVLVPEIDIVERIRETDPTVVAKSLVSAIREYARAIEAQRLVIDPIAPLVTLEKDVQVLREYIRALIMGIERDVGTTNIITTEIPTGSRSISRYGVEEFLAAGVLIVGIAQTMDGDFRRYVFVRKMRWQPAQPAIYEMEILPGVGIVVRDRLRNVYLPYTSTTA